jgi:hypothetical protein
VADVLAVTEGVGVEAFGVKVALLELGLGDGLPGPMVQLAQVVNVRATATTAAASCVRVTANFTSLLTEGHSAGSTESGRSQFV